MMETTTTRTTTTIEPEESATEAPSESSAAAVAAAAESGRMEEPRTRTRTTTGAPAVRGGGAAAGGGGGSSSLRQDRKSQDEEGAKRSSASDDKTTTATIGATKPMSYKERRKMNNPNRKRHGARNQHKTKHFVKWLQETFPCQLGCNADRDSSNNSNQHQDRHESSEQQPQRQKQKQGPILDVAGGKGELSARLCVCCNREVILVDPRPSDPLGTFESAVLKTIPKKWQDRLAAKVEGNPDFLPDLFRDRFEHRASYFDDATLREDPGLADAVRRSCLIVGLHADGATEPIVDAALEHGKPFVVVPCCVFPNLFPHRRVVVVCNRGVGDVRIEADEKKGHHGNDDGNGAMGTAQATESVPVRTYEDFCLYLSQKDPRLKTSVLPFEGRNVAIWWDGAT